MRLRGVEFGRVREGGSTVMGRVTSEEWAKAKAVWASMPARCDAFEQDLRDLLRDRRASVGDVWFCCHGLLWSEFVRAIHPVGMRLIRWIDRAEARVEGRYAR